MKPKTSLHSFLALAGSSLLAISSASASTLYWDGTSTSVKADGGNSGSSDWINGTNTNWDTLAFGGADTVWTNGAHTAVFGGAAGTVNIGTGGVTVGGLIFNTSGYVINAGSNGLTFSSGTNVIQSYIGNTSITANGINATITGAVSGTGSNIVLNSAADQRIFQLNLNGTSSGGWTGTTTINAGTTMALSQSNQALLNTSGITLNGGNILLTNTATGSENTLDRVSNSAAIASYGSGSIAIANTATASRAYSEIIGSITHYNGQLSIGFTTVQNQTSNTQTLLLGGLTRSGTSTVAVNSGGSGAGSISANSNIRISGITTATLAGEIIGPWMTAGTITGAQSDWAVYASSDGVSGRIGSRGTAASAQSTWTSSSATGNYLAANAIVTTNPVNNRLTVDRMINTLRATYAESNAASHTMDSGTDTITFTGHALSNGDVVAFRSAGGLTDTRPYYVINSAVNTFQLSLTPGGSLLDLTSDTEGFITTGLNLNGNKLGLNGFIVGTTGIAAIGGGSASTLTLPTTSSGNLYLHGAASYWIDPSIKDNGAGMLTLVKSGTNTVTLSGNNTYTGGTVINNGILSFQSAGSWVSGQDITFGGAGRINASVGALTGDVLDVNQGAVGYITGTSAITFTTTTGAGKITYGGSASTLALGNASTFTGDLQVSNAIGNNSTVTFSSIGDTAGSSIQYGGGSTVTTDQAVIAYDGTSALTLSNRQIQLLPRSTQNNVPGTNVLMNNSANPAHKLVISQNLLNTSDRSAVFQLDGSNTGNNEFSGNIGNSTYSNVANPTLNTLSVVKNGDGKWILSGSNSYTGTSAVTAGTLLINGSTSTSSAFTVAANATLGGTGTIGGSVSVSASGILSPGASIESLAAASLSMASGSTFAYEVANDTGTGADLLAVATTVSLTGVNLSLDATSLAALAGGGWSLSDKITLISYLGADITSGFTGYLDDTSYFFGLNEWLFNYNDTAAGGNYGTDAIAAGQNRFVTMTAVTVIPEPRAALLGGLGLLALLRRRRD